MARAFLPPPITDDRALGGSTIERSLKFNSSDTAYLTRTNGSGGNRTTFTWSGWIKRTKRTNDYQAIFTGQNAVGAASNDGLFLESDRIHISWDYDDSGQNVRGTQTLEDHNGWYHLVWAVDTTLSTASDRMKMYVNGSQYALDSTVAQNENSGVNKNTDHNLGIWRNGGSTNYKFDGYMAEVHFVDGQQLTPSSFGYTDFQTGIWRPKKYEGTHGTTGFYLDFNDNSAATATTIGKDRSGNANDFTPTNISVSTGVGNDSTLDSPSNNFCTWNSQFGNPSAYLIPSEGNLQCNGVSGNNHLRQQSTRVLHSGKWYCELKMVSGYNGNDPTIRMGICTPNSGHRHPGNDHIYYENSNNFTSVSFSQNGSVYLVNTTQITGLTTYANGDVLGIALDLDNDRFFISKNGTFFSNGTGTQDPVTGANPLYSGGVLTSRKNLDGFVIAAGVYSDKIVTADFGQHGFAYTPPTGFKAITSNNIAPTSPNIIPKKHFDILTYAGNDSSDRNITGLEFKPDFVWIKNRSQGDWHIWVDSVRGANKQIYSNVTSAESTDNVNGHVNSFIEGGFNVDAGGQGNVNENSENYVAWCWKAGGAAVTNNDGTIASQVSVNSDAGFSIVTYTGNATAGATVGHGLGKVPHWIIIKKRTGDNWMVYSHAYSGYDGTAKGRYMELNETAGLNNDTRMMNDTAPTSSVFSLRADGSTNHPNGGTFVAYCWSEIPGYSKFSSYVGNGNANGQYVYMGFRPAWILIKRDTTESWVLVDVKRNSTAGRRTPADAYVLPNTADGENTGVIYDFLSDGIKFGNTSQNEAGAVYYYWAFAEQTGATPFGTDVNAG